MQTNQIRFNAVNAPVSKGPPKIKCWRSLRRDDLEAIKRMIKPSTRVLFGKFTPERMIELSPHQIVVENVDNDITSCMCLRSVPNIPDDAWKEMVSKNLSCRKLTSANTLFAHMMVWDPRYDWEWVLCVLKSLFLSVFGLQYVAICAPVGSQNQSCFRDRLLAKYFQQIQLGKREKTQMELYVATRSKILPSLKIRRAVIEDNDDLVSMLERTAPKLRDRYGEFFISEIIQNSSQTREIIVAEYKNESVGMMSFNSNVNMELLEEVFELKAYNYLLRFDTSKNSGSDSNERVVPPSTTDTEETDEDTRLKSDLNWKSTDVFTPPESLHAAKSDEHASSINIRMSVWQGVRNARLSSCSDSEEDDQEANPSFSVLMSYTNAGRHQKSNFFSYISEGGDKNEVDDLHSVGEPNCFVLELHSMRDDTDPRLVLDLLMASFEAYPDRQYCIVTVPTYQPHIPLLSYFVRAFKKKAQTFERRSTLYMLHRNALFSAITVRPIRLESDMKSVHEFMQHMPNSELIEEAIRTINPDTQTTYVFEMEGQIIGVSTIEVCDHFNTLVLDYDLRSFLNKNCHNRPGESSIIKMLLLQPAFTMRSPYIFAELFRLTGSNVLFFKLSHDLTSDTKDLPPINTLLNEMESIRPRLRMQYDLERLRAEQHPPPYVLEPGANHNRFALYAQTVQSGAARKLQVNERLIVVGCGQTTLAFLEHIIFSERSRGVWFTQLTVISTVGFSALEYEDISPLAQVFNVAATYTPSFIRRLSFGTWVQTVYGTVTAIDRAGRFVTVDGRKRVHYDKLLLFCGLQFDYPVRIKVPKRQPKNVVFVNNLLEAEDLLQRLTKLMQGDRECDIIVYGDNVECYTCLQMVIESGVPPELITYVRPRAQSAGGFGVTTFNDKYVNDVMRKVLNESGMRLLENCDLTDWKLDAATGCVSKLNVEGDLNIFELQCTLLICFERKIVSRPTIIAINDAGLVFDGRLVIDEKYQTSDEFIYAAGPMTKFKRQLYADDCRHEFVCTQEVGKRIADMILNALSPIKLPVVKSMTIKDPVFVYRQAKMFNRPVLGNLHYMHIRAPLQPLPYDLAKNMDTYGVDLVTGMDENIDLAQPMNYCRVHLNEYNLVSTIVCLTTSKLNMYKYKQLWGKHESAFSNMKLHFEQNIITDLHEYFKLPWVYYLIHDNFTTDLRRKNKKLVLDILKKDKDLLKFLKDSIVQNKWQKLDDKQRLQFAEEFITSSYDCVTNMSNVEFIVEHIDELSMYFDPKRTKITFSHD